MSGTRATTGWKAKTDYSWWNMHQCWNGGDDDLNGNNISPAISFRDTAFAWTHNPSNGQFKQQLFPGLAEYMWTVRVKTLHEYYGYAETESLQATFIQLIGRKVHLGSSPDGNSEIFGICFHFLKLSIWQFFMSGQICAEVTHIKSLWLHLLNLGFPTFETIMRPESHKVSPREKDQKRSATIPSKLFQDDGCWGPIMPGLAAIFTV